MDSFVPSLPRAMKNAFFKLALPSFLPPGPVRRELYFWVLFASLHALLGTGLVALLPYRPHGRPEPGKYPSPAEGPEPPVVMHAAGNDRPAYGPLPAFAHFLLRPVAREVNRVRTPIREKRTVAARTRRRAPSAGRGLSGIPDFIEQPVEYPQFVGSQVRQQVVDLADLPVNLCQ